MITVLCRFFFTGGKFAKLQGSPGAVKLLALIRRFMESSLDLKLDSRLLRYLYRKLLYSFFSNFVFVVDPTRRNDIVDYI